MMRNQICMHVCVIDVAASQYYLPNSKMCSIDSPGVHSKNYRHTVSNHLFMDSGEYTAQLEVLHNHIRLKCIIWCSAGCRKL